jgi:ATP-dependent DNA ligase
MNAYDAARLIEEIGATSSRTEKERLTKILADAEIGKFILQWAYNPFITFGLNPALSENAGKFKIEFKPSLVEGLLKRLSSRELTGHAAEREVGEVMGALDEDGARLLFLILSKDLKCGIAENTINQAVPGLVPVFSVQRAQTYEAKRMTSVMKGEYKLDGNRNTFLCKDNDGGFFTRTGKRVAALDFMVPPVIKAAKAVVQQSELLQRVMVRKGETTLNFMLDGEAMMTLFEETGAFRRTSEDALGAELHLYDMMSFDDFDAPGAVGEILEVRRTWVAEFVRLAKIALAGTKEAEAIQIVPQFFVNDDAEVQALFDRARSKTLASYLARGNAEREKDLLTKTIDKATGKPKVLEGIVVKDPKAKYEKKKSWVWMKLKAEETLDLRITGAYPGKPHTELQDTLGGIQVVHKGVPVNVGGGYERPERDEIWALWNEDRLNGTIEIIKVANGKKLISYNPNPGYTPKLVSRLLEVEFMEETPDGSLRHPRAIRFRDDKDGEVEVKEAA